MIRFRVPAHALERVAFAYSALLEAVLSLHVLVAPKHHPLQHPWVRTMRGLPPSLKRRIAELSFLYSHYVPDFLFPAPGGDYLSFEGELERVLELPADELTLELVRPIWDHAGVRDVRKLRRKAVRDALAARSEVALLALDDPEAVMRRFAKLMRDYWRAGFQDEWERLEPQLADAVSEAGRTLAADGVYALLHGLSRQLVVDPRRETFGKDIPHDHVVTPSEENPLVFVPSAYAWPHVWLNCDAPWPLAVVYPAPFVLRAARPEIPSSDLLQVLRALGDDTRLRALKLIAEHPRSTQELAPLVGISEGGLSKHLRALHQAGLVETRRDGYYVLYSLVPERIEPVSEALLGYLSGVR